MIRYTTPTLALSVEGEDITDKDVYVTLVQSDVKITKKKTDLTLSTETIMQTVYTKIQFSLSQEESASFEPRCDIAIQVNWIGSDGVRGATTQQNIGSLQNLLDEVIEYGN